MSRTHHIEPRDSDKERINARACSTKCIFFQALSKASVDEVRRHPRENSLIHKHDENINKPRSAKLKKRTSCRYRKCPIKETVIIIGAYILEENQGMHKGITTKAKDPSVTSYLVNSTLCRTSYTLPIAFT